MDRNSFHCVVMTKSLSTLAITFKAAQQKTADIIKDRVLVGHAVYNDLKALMLDHPRALIRDTSRYKPFRKHAKGRTPGLKLLVKEVLNMSIQTGSHSSVSQHLRFMDRIVIILIYETRLRMQGLPCYFIKKSRANGIDL
jgi:DNA polymerase III epsilon subunit-like protein